MKIFSIITRVLFIIAVPAFLISLSIGIAVNSKWLYEAGFKKYDISRVTGITEPELDKAAAGLISYFNNGNKYIDVWITKDGQPYKLYSEDEKQILHLRDVKALFWLDYKVLLGSFLFITGYIATMVWKKNRQGLAYGLVGGGGLTLGLMFMLGVGIITNFNNLFIDFHLISFSNNYWLLNPNKDYLLMMFPDGFWFDAASFIALLTAVLAVVMGATGWFLLHPVQHRHPHESK